MLVSESKVKALPQTRAEHNHGVPSDVKSISGVKEIFSYSFGRPTIFSRAWEAYLPGTSDHSAII